MKKPETNICCICGKTFTRLHAKSSQTCDKQCMHELMVMRKTKHGDAKIADRNKLYGLWAAIKRRCYNKTHEKYRFYGAKGIILSEEWFDYNNFKLWCLSNGYKEGLTIDRIDSNKNYSPDNCRFITIQEQQKNKCSNVYYEYNGTRMILADWSRHLGITPEAIHNRIHKLSWDLDKALTTKNTKVIQCQSP